MSTISPSNAPFDPDDLALNRPGATLREKSLEIRQAHPVLVFMLRLFGQHSDERAWRRGAEGEEEVAYQLRKLGEGWRVIHSVPVGTADTDIDHVVIGPPGVFTLNTKNHLGGRVSVNAKAVYVNGTYQPYIAKSRAEGKRATKLLSTACGYVVAARPLIVIMANDLRLKGSPEGVNVIGRKQISKWLLRQPPILTNHSVEAIYAVARRRPTWVG
ncbi:MAG TPA: nuclease-related domain-containing protein [Acidimicrobiales bacterium]